MKQTINFSQFVDGFNSRKDNFSYNGLKALYEYFENLEEDCETEIEFDPIGICCEYTEYENLEEFQGNYGSDYNCFEDIQNATQLIMIDEDSFIILDF